MELSSNQPIFGTKISTNVKIKNIFIAYSLFLGKKLAKSQDKKNYKFFLVTFPPRYWFGSMLKSILKTFERGGF
jgi:hypothetical protein